MGSMVSPSKSMSAVSTYEPERLFVTASSSSWVEIGIIALDLARFGASGQPSESALISACVSLPPVMAGLLPQNGRGPLA